MDRYNIESKTNISTKIKDSFYIGYLGFLLYKIIEPRVYYGEFFFSKIEIIGLGIICYFLFTLLKDFIYYKTIKVTYHELIFFYPLLRKEVRIQKKDIRKSVLEKYEHSLFNSWTIMFWGRCYHELTIYTGNKNYTISSMDYINFWEIFNKIGTKIGRKDKSSKKKN